MLNRHFGVRQSRFAIIRGPARFWQRNVLKDIMYACIILHNIIVEDEKNTYESLFDFSYDDMININNASTVKISHRPISNFATILQRNAEICDKNVHPNLQADLVEHLWSKFGSHFNYNFSYLILNTNVVLFSNF